MIGLSFRKRECRRGGWLWFLCILLLILFCCISLSYISDKKEIDITVRLEEYTNYITGQHNGTDNQVQDTSNTRHFDYVVVSEKWLNTKNSTKTTTKNTAKKTDPLSPRIPHSIGDHIYFMTYNGKHVFTNQDTTRGMTGRIPFKLERKMFEQITQEAVKYLGQNSSKFNMKDCNYIRYRLIPTVGIEYDITCRKGQSHLSERVTLLQKFNASEVIFHQQQEQNMTTSRVNIIVPLKGRPRTFSLFLESIQRVQEQEKLKLGLTVVYFNDSNTEEIRNILRDAQRKTKGLETHFILLESQPFSRSKGLQIGAEKSLVKSNVLFLTDVDIFFSKEFLHRCQANVVQGSQVYFPMVFSLYNPDFIYPLIGKKLPAPLDTHKIGDDHGYWRVWGHGMVCLHKGDFLKINGFNKKRKGWGGEDINFLSATVKKKYKVIRAIEPGLYHHYHYKNCADSGKGQNSACRKVRATSEASRMNLGLWFFRQKLNVSVYGLLKDGPQPYDAESLDEAELRDEYLTTLVHSTLVLSVALNIILAWFVFVTCTTK